MGILDFFLNGNNDKNFNQELGNLEELDDETENFKNKEIRKEKLLEYEYYKEENE